MAEVEAMRRRIEAAAEALEDGMDADRIAKRLGVHRSTVYEWRRLAEGRA